MLKEISFPKEKSGYSIIKVNYMGICRTDIHVAENRFKIDNIVIGHEVSGSIYQSEKFKEGEIVGIDPYTEDGMHGLTENGYFSQYISVPNHKIHPVNNKFLSTYLEPIAASLLNIEVNGSVAIYGRGRIPQILQKILELDGVNAE